MHTSRELNRVNHLLTKMFYQERMGILNQNFDTKFFYIDNGNLSFYAWRNLFLSWI